MTIPQNAAAQPPSSLRACQSRDRCVYLIAYLPLWLQMEGVLWSLSYVFTNGGVVSNRGNTVVAGHFQYAFPIFFIAPMAYEIPKHFL